MDILFDVLLFIHIVAFVAGGASSVVMPVLGVKMATATPDALAIIFHVGRQLSRVGRGAMAVLLVTGPLMFWIKWTGVVPSIWFWAKMALIVVMLVGIVVAGVGMKRVQAGDASAEVMTRRAGMITSVAFAGVLLSAVFAFS